MPGDGAEPQGSGVEGVVSQSLQHLYPRLVVVPLVPSESIGIDLFRERAPPVEWFLMVSC